MKQGTAAEGLIPQIPETDFDRWLLEQVMRAAGIFDHSHPVLGPVRSDVIDSGLRATIRLMEDDPCAPDDPAWTKEGRRRCWLVIEEPDHDPLDFLSGDQFPIEVWVVEHECPATEYFRGYVMWELPTTAFSGDTQSNRFPDWPVLFVPTE